MFYFSWDRHGRSLNRIYKPRALVEFFEVRQFVSRVVQDVSTEVFRTDEESEVFQTFEDQQTLTKHSPRRKEILATNVGCFCVNEGIQVNI